MTTDVVINNIINDLCQRFNVASSELIPRLQAYAMAMNKFGAITAGIFCVALVISMIFYLKQTQIGQIFYVCLLVSLKSFLLSR